MSNGDMCITASTNSINLNLLNNGYPWRKAPSFSGMNWPTTGRWNFIISKTFGAGRKIFSNPSVEHHLFWHVIPPASILIEYCL
jgi:hypothetical protein